MANLDTHRAVTRIKDAGSSEPHAEAIVDTIQEATSEFVTTDYLRAELNKAVLEVGAIILAVAALAIGATELLK